MQQIILIYDMRASMLKAEAPLAGDDATGKSVSPIITLALSALMCTERASSSTSPS